MSESTGGRPAEAVRYHFGDGTRAGVMLGLSLRQAAPLVGGSRLADARPHDRKP